MTVRRPSLLGTAVLLTLVLLAAVPWDAWSAQASGQAGVPAPQPVPSADCPGLSVLLGNDPNFSIAQQICSANFMACVNGYNPGSYTISLCSWGTGTCICYYQSLTTLPTPAQCNPDFEACMARANPNPVIDP